MGFFSKKRKEDKLLPLPEFPRLPNEPNFPFYDEQLGEKKDFFQKQEFKKIVPTEEFTFEKSVPQKEEIDFEFTQRKQPLTFEKREERPVYVKVEKYRESVKAVSSIKSKLEEVDIVLKNLARLREQEEKELEEWQNNLDEIRQKLIKIDKDLFEV